MVYRRASGEVYRPRRLVWLDRQGQEEPVASETRPYAWVRLSPDGRRVATYLNDLTNPDVWIYDLERDTLTRLTFDSVAELYPLWTPDGERVVYSTGGTGPQNPSSLFSRAADGTGEAERLTTAEYLQVPSSF